MIFPCVIYSHYSISSLCTPFDYENKMHLHRPRLVAIELRLERIQLRKRGVRIPYDCHFDLHTITMSMIPIRKMQ